MTTRHMWINEWGWRRPNQPGSGRVPADGDVHTIEVVGVDGYDFSGFKLEFYTAGP